MPHRSLKEAFAASSPHEMDTSLEALIERTRGIVMTPRQRYLQRIDWAYGTLHFSDPTVTREMIEEAARLLYGNPPAPEPSGDEDSGRK